MHMRSQRAAQALAEARKSERRFRDLTELSADWFWETDAAHCITWISGGTPVATFFGGIPTYGKRFWEIPGVQVESRVLEAMHEGMEERRPFFDLEMTRADERGARQIHIISGQSRKDAAGRFLGYRGAGPAGPPPPAPSGTAGAGATSPSSGAPSARSLKRRSAWSSRSAPPTS